jgi:hypothetical protein
LKLILVDELVQAESEAEAVSDLDNEEKIKEESLDDSSDETKNYNDEFSEL